MENTRPHYPVPEVPEGKIIFHDDVLHWLVKHVGNHIKDLTPDVGSEELCATTAHANVVAKLYVLWPKEKDTWKDDNGLEIWWENENLQNSPRRNLVGFNTRFKGKKISFHRRYLKRLFNNFWMISSLPFFVDYPVESCNQKLIRCIQVQQAE